MKFYSELLDKMFETEMDLVAAEEVAKKEEAKKKEASEAKKMEAKKVEEAFKAFNAAKRVFNEEVLNIKKKFNLDLNEIKKNHDEAMLKATTARDEAEKNYKNTLDEFTKKHPEGYHMTLKDGDHVVTISQSAANDASSVILEQLLNPKSFWDLFKL